MLINGKEISKQIKEDIKKEVELLKEEGKRVPCLAVILIGDDPASQVYVRNKIRACEFVGMKSMTISKDASFTQEELLALIDSLNKNEEVDGILVQLPVPDHIDEQAVIEAIDPSKDVDGFHPSNIAKLVLNEDGFVPCTPQGMMWKRSCRCRKKQYCRKAGFIVMLTS